MRLSSKGLMVLNFVLRRADQEVSGAEIMKGIGVGSGTLYPLLMRFESSGWMESRWEDVDPSLEGRPRRRLYRLTGEGRTRAISELEQIYGSPAVGGTFKVA